MDVALLQYILKKKKEGISDEEISQKLLAQGWPKEAIDEGLNHVAVHPEQVAFHETTFSSTLLDPIELINRSFELILKHIGNVIFLSFIPSVIGALFIILGIFFAYIKFGSASIPNLFSTPSSIISTITTVFIGIVILSLLYAWCYTAIYELFTTEDEKIGWWTALKRSSDKVIPFSWTLFLFSFITTGGFILFVVPGILFSIWFSFAPIIFFTEKERGMNALLKSREYVKGITMQIFLRQILIFACLIGVSMIAGFLGIIMGSSGSSRIIGELLSFVLNLFVTPFTIAYIYLLYKNVQSVKGNVQIHQKSQNTVVFLIVGMVGVLIFLSLLISGFIFVRKIVQTRMDNARIIQYQMNTTEIERALEMYYIEKGAFPNSLEDLIPVYIKQDLLNSPPGLNYEYKTNFDKSSFILCPPIAEKSTIGCISSQVNLK